MESQPSILLIRDAKIGKFLLGPPDDDLGRWLVSGKVGLGRASKNCWDVLKSIDQKFLRDIERERAWSLSFSNYYDVVLWIRSLALNLVHSTQRCMMYDSVPARWLAC